MIDPVRWPPPSGESERDPRPVVALPRPGLSGLAIAGASAVLALALFLSLNARREASRAAPVDQTALASPFAAPPTLEVPPDLVPDAAPPVALLPAPAMGGASMPERSRRPSEPAAVPPQPYVAAPAPAQAGRNIRAEGAALVYDNGPIDTAQEPNGSSEPGLVKPANDDAAARTTIIADRSSVMAAGTMIPAVLETPIDSSRPGMIRAIVSEDSRGFDGRLILVPRGARLIGEYQSNVSSGQNRVLVTWTRLIRPDGVSIRILSPAADPVGRAGVPGRLNTFFFQRFANAVLQSALTLGVNLASRPRNGSVIVGVPGTAGSVSQTLTSSDPQPKITVRQGTMLSVFVARDLDFSGAPLPRQRPAR